MELTPDLLLEAKFSAARRGYDMAEVDDFLERCAEGLDVLLARLRAEFDRAERAEAEVAALRADGASDGFDGDAPLPAAAVTQAEPEAGDEVAIPDEAPVADAPIPVGEPMRILIHAERTAEAAIAEATADAARIRSEAEEVATSQRTEAETLLERARAEAEAEARRAGDEARAAIQGEVVTLRRDRDALTDDIRLLRRWLDEQRGRLRTTARDLQRIADDPGGLRDVPPPETSGAPHGELAGDEIELPGGGEDEADDTAGDGEPTQAVPVFDVGRPFDDDSDPSTDPGD